MMEGDPAVAIGEKIQGTAHLTRSIFYGIDALSPSDEPDHADLCQRPQTRALIASPAVP